MSKDNLGDRMKSFYEDAYRIHLPRRMPLIVRYDGKAFHSYTKGCKKPVDQKLVDCMNETAIYVCKNVQGCKVGYVQSDEVSLLITNYNDINTESYFDNNLQKIVSVISAMASSYFTSISDRIFGKIKLAQFDARAFVLPKEEVNNYFLFRQQDATRNSVQMLARSLYSHKECTDKNNSELQEMIFQKGINWNDCPTSQKRGRCLIKTKAWKEGINPQNGNKFLAQRNEWVVDNEIPIFSQNKDYINQFVFPKEEVELEKL
jgi:tRNA(His) guanylyltransferase